MKPDEKLKLQISRALDTGYSKYTAWEISFLKNVQELFDHRFKAPSPKQKKMAYELTKSYKPD